MIHHIWLRIALLLLCVISGIKNPAFEEECITGLPRWEIEDAAEWAGISPDEFELMSAIVEAESDRSDSIHGKTMIALTIFCRQESENFPNSITGVITQSGAFQVYYEGTYRSTGRTATSDLAVILASMWMKADHPHVVYFNCIGYNNLGTPFAYVDGNYFETEG